MNDPNAWRDEHGPFDEHPWVLVTSEDRATTHEISRAWVARGHEVFVCAGPGASRPCLLLDGDGCPIADRAHVIVNGLDPASPEVGRLLAALRARHPDLPVVDAATPTWRSGPAPH